MKGDGRSWDLIHGEGLDPDLTHFIKSVNDDVLGKIQIIVKENPGCRQLVKCELAYHAPQKLKK